LEEKYVSLVEESDKHRIEVVKIFPVWEGEKDMYKLIVKSPVGELFVQRETYADYGLRRLKRLANDYDPESGYFCNYGAGHPIDEFEKDFVIGDKTLSALPLEYFTWLEDFDGVDALRPIPDDRRVYFSGWMRHSPAGFVKGTRKFIYNPTANTAFAYDLSTDPLELLRLELPEQQAQEITDEIIAWRKNSVFRLDQERAGEKMLFDSWLCRWNNRVSSAKYRPEPVN